VILMGDAAALARMQAQIVRLEETLAEYVLRYGLTDRARELFREAAAGGNEAGRTQADGPQELGR
jgi:hypothetical protein